MYFPDCFSIRICDVSSFGRLLCHTTFSSEYLWRQCYWGGVSRLPKSNCTAENIDENGQCLILGADFVGSTLTLRKKFWYEYLLVQYCCKLANVLSSSSLFLIKLGSFMRVNSPVWSDHLAILLWRCVFEARFTSLAKFDFSTVACFFVSVIRLVSSHWLYMTLDFFMHG